MSATSRGHNADQTKRKRRWRTPPDVFAYLSTERTYDLDAAAEANSALCPRYIGAPDALHGPEHGPQMVARNCLTGGWIAHSVWFNPPWGASTVDFPGTGAFIDVAIKEARRGQEVTILVSTAPDTTWWRAAFRASYEVRLTPRLAFLDPDTGVPAQAPPGAGCTLFFLRGVQTRRPTVQLADKVGRTIGAP